MNHRFYFADVRQLDNDPRRSANKSGRKDGPLRAARSWGVVDLTNQDHRRKWTDPFGVYTDVGVGVTPCTAYGYVPNYTSVRVESRGPGLSRTEASRLAREADTVFAREDLVAEIVVRHDSNGYEASRKAHLTVLYDAEVRAAGLLPDSDADSFRVCHDAVHQNLAYILTNAEVLAGPAEVLEGADRPFGFSDLTTIIEGLDAVIELHSKYAAKAAPWAWTPTLIPADDRGRDDVDAMLASPFVRELDKNRLRRWKSSQPSATPAEIPTNLGHEGMGLS